MAEWWAFIVAVISECLRWLSSMTLWGVPVLGIIVGFFLLTVLIREMLIKP